MWLVYSSIVLYCHRFLCMPWQNNRDRLQEKRGPALHFVLLFNLLGNECSWTAPFGVPRNSHELVYLRIMLLISRFHVIALLFVLLFNLLGNESSWTAPFGVPRNPHALVYLFKELLLISRCHVIALLFVLLFNILGNECSWAASFGVPRSPHALVSLFKELLLRSRCHAISVLLFLCVQIRVLWLKIRLNLFRRCFCFVLVLGKYCYFSSLDFPAGCVWGAGVLTFSIPSLSSRPESVLFCSARSVISGPLLSFLWLAAVFWS